MGWQHFQSISVVRRGFAVAFTLSASAAWAPYSHPSGVGKRYMACVERLADRNVAVRHALIETMRSKRGPAREWFILYRTAVAPACGHPSGRLWLGEFPDLVGDEADEGMHTARVANLMFFSSRVRRSKDGAVLGWTPYTSKATS